MGNHFQSRRRAPWARRRLVWGLALALASCTPDPLDYSGKLCNADRPCPSGWDCPDGTCHSTSSRNRVKNGDFETGVTGWVTSHGTLKASATGRASAGALQWNPDGTGDSVLTLDAPVVDAPEAGAWCAQAWVQGADGKEAELDVLQEGESGEVGTAKASGGIWTRLQSGTLAMFSRPLNLTLRSSADAGVRQLLVDDVALWKDSVTNLCANPP